MPPRAVERGECACAEDSSFEPLACPQQVCLAAREALTECYEDEVVDVDTCELGAVTVFPDGGTTECTAQYACASDVELFLPRRGRDRGPG